MITAVYSRLVLIGNFCYIQLKLIHVICEWKLVLYAVFLST